MQHREEHVTAVVMWKVLLLLLPAIALCFSALDLEIFKLRDAVANDLGEDTTFYSWLGVKPGAKHNEIRVAYRKLSRRLHPDRNPGVAANERFARLNNVYKILRSAGRDQYDHYLRHGFPKYKADSGEYSFSRYRPTLFVVVALVGILLTVVHFVMLKADAKRRRAHFENLSQDVRDAATVKSKTGVLTASANVQLNGRNFIVEPTGEVYFEGELVTGDAVDEPTIWDTVLLRPFVKRAAEPEAPVAERSASPDADASKTAEEPLLKKGAIRRRPAGARGKAKIF